MKNSCLHQPLTYYDLADLHYDLLVTFTRSVFNLLSVYMISPYSHTYCHAYYYWYSITHRPTHSFTLGLILPFLQILPTAAFPFSHSGFTIWIFQTVYCYF